MGVYDRKIWNFLLYKVGNAIGVAGLMGNLYAESGLLPNNMENAYEITTGYTDVIYTSAVDNGTYTEQQFVNDAIGYGLAQWTFYTRKQGLYNLKKKRGVSISDIDLQLEYLWQELQTSFPAVLSQMQSATDLKTVSDYVLEVYENPKNQSNAVKNERYNNALKFYNTYSNSDIVIPPIEPEPEQPEQPNPPTPPEIVGDNIYEMIETTSYKTNTLSDEQKLLLQSIKINDIIVINKKLLNRNKTQFGYSFTNSKLTLVHDTYYVRSVMNNGFIRLQYADEKTYIYINPRVILRKDDTQ